MKWTRKMRALAEAKREARRWRDRYESYCDCVHSEWMEILDLREEVERLKARRPVVCVAPVEAGKALEFVGTVIEDEGEGMYRIEIPR